MKALVYTGPERLEVREAPDPLAGAGEVLVRVDSVGICGSDMHAYLGHDERRPAPLILGHEAAGTIVAGPSTGQRVTINPLVTCGECRACKTGRDNLCAKRQIISMPPREGAFAELLAMPERNLVEIPPGVDVDHAALAEPIACGWHAVRLARAALDRPLEACRCLVIGGGAVGLGAALVLDLNSAMEVWLAETNHDRHTTLQRAGDFAVFDPRSGGGPADGTADLVIDAVGLAATRAAGCAAARPGGVIVHIGLGDAAGGLDIRRMTLQEITFIGTYTYTPADFRATAAAIFAGRLGPLDWIELRPLDHGQAAFADIRRARAAAAPKIILKP